MSQMPKPNKRGRKPNWFDRRRAKVLRWEAKRRDNRAKEINDE
jgi:hypothetical protein